MKFEQYKRNDLYYYSAPNIPVPSQSFLVIALGWLVSGEAAKSFP
ncbi:hypothetical protein STFR1_10088 [Bacillus vallismortis]